MNGYQKRHMKRQTSWRQDVMRTINRKIDYNYNHMTYEKNNALDCDGGTPTPVAEGVGEKS